MSDYDKSGVSISTANKLIDSIRRIAPSTKTRGMIGEIGGFGGLFDLKAAGFEDAILVAATDGVGTKLKIAHQTNIHHTIGIDLVAMCVNDILAQGAKPLFFLDYLATGKLDLKIAQQIMEGIAAGCKEAGVALIGGETAEMPGIYMGHEYDLAGFAVGAVNRDALLPQKDKIAVGDKIIGIFSSGIHANGFSLIRKVFNDKNINYSDASPWKGQSWVNVLLQPTRIYTGLLLKKLGSIKALAHITGGGMVENLPRVLPDGLCAQIDSSAWQTPEIFGWLMQEGSISGDEMFRVFNMGIGMALIVGEDKLDSLTKDLPQHEYVIIGEIIQKKSTKFCFIN
ncbi:phosphoribosylformylglycinamidine cyclo-ligase [Rickettsiales bacterium]|nr:phosphoribosylformylglycinamidine cyclo-ligase [Rickettsiales bacterium]